jgi:DNA-binding NarL/FixJ family response regulator
MTIKIIEIKGKCKVCNQEDFLADGLCAKCWDRTEDSKTLRQQFLDSKESLKESFTKREIEVMTLLSTGMTNKSIAHYLYISPSTVDAHLTSILSKCNVPDWANPRVWLAVNIKKVIDGN